MHVEISSKQVTVAAMQSTQEPSGLGPKKLKFFFKISIAPSNGHGVVRNDRNQTMPRLKLFSSSEGKKILLLR